MAVARNDLYIGNTDHDWFEFCSQRSHLSEVNFWQPTAQHFKALEEGGIFFFRRKSPINKIGGFGRLVSSHVASIGLLWDDLGESNGVANETDFIERVRKYTQKKLVDRKTQVGFKIISEQVFLSKDEWFPLPPDWSNNIVTGKGYSSHSDSGRYLMEKYRTFSARRRFETENLFEIPGFKEGDRAGYAVAMTRKRLGQSAFRSCVIAAYDGACAVTNCTVLESIDAAHIGEFSVTQSHSTANGVLLRKDLHSLIDNQLAYIDEDMSFRLSGRFFDIYPLDKEYRAFDKVKLRLPKRKEHWPSIDYIRLRKSHLEQ